MIMEGGGGSLRRKRHDTDGLPSSIITPANTTTTTTTDPGEANRWHQGEDLLILPQEWSDQAEAR